MSPERYVIPTSVPSEEFDPAGGVDLFAGENRKVAEKGRAEAAKTRQAQENLNPVAQPAKTGSGIAGAAPVDPSTGQPVAGGVNTYIATGELGAATGKDPWVYRIDPNSYKDDPRLAGRFKKAVDTNKYDFGKTSTLDLFNAEYQKRIYEGDAAFKDWLAKRAAVLFQKDLYDKNGNFDILGGEDVWKQFGIYTATNPDLQKNMTPEQWADATYNKYGGDTSYQAWTDAKAAANKAEDPITRRTTTSTMTMNKAAAEGAVDELARGLLGRMASDSELAKYRKQINAFLKSNPNVRTEVQDATDPSNIKVTSSEKAGATPTDAASVLEMKLRRGSEGMAFNVGQMFEEALARADRNL